jgi:hypothetical protein
MKETLEEAAERLFPFTKDDSENRIITIKRFFWIDGAKWQQERMYSEEEVLKAIGAARVFYKTDEDDGYDEFKYTPIEIIHSLKQFKK